MERTLCLGKARKIEAYKAKQKKKNIVWKKLLKVEVIKSEPQSPLSHINCIWIICLLFT